MSISERLDNGSPSLFNDPLFSDLKIKFSGQTINCHKAILCQKSEYILKAVTSPFKESHTGVIDLGDDDNPECVITMLRNPYGLEVDDVENIAFLIELFATSDKYDFPGVRSVATQLYEAKVECNWSCNPKRVIAGFHSVLSQEWADKQLFTATMVLCAKHVEDSKGEKSFKSLLDEIPGLAAKLLLDAFDNMGDAEEGEPHLRKCPQRDHVDQATEDEIRTMEWTRAKCDTSAHDASPDWDTGRFWSRKLAGNTFLDEED